MIYLDNVSIQYRAGDVGLQDVTLSISQGEFVTVIGHSGAGKTSLIKVLLAETHPSSGKVFFDSLDLATIKPSRLNQFRRRIGVVFQEFRLLSNKTVYENVAFAMQAAGKSDAEIAEDVPYVLRLVGLSEKATRFPQDLSGGQKQRVAIARAIVNQPDVVIADEPTGNLDAENTIEIINILRKINELGTTVILTTHDESILKYVDKRILTMDHGKIIKDEQKESASLK
ncbi:MAG: cell division ATP-binding protein FtsE [Patescibacteria group bacterium]